MHFPRGFTSFLFFLLFALTGLTTTACTTADPKHLAIHINDPTATTTCAALLADWTERYSQALAIDDPTPETAELGESSAEAELAEQTVTHLRLIHQLDSDAPDLADTHRGKVEDIIVEGCHESHPSH